MKLTDTKCKNAKPNGKTQKISDGKGLYLEVNSKGSKYWRLKYSINGKEKRLALGVYPDVTLKQARKATDKARELIARNIDPSAEKKARKQQALVNSANTFKHEINVHGCTPCLFDDLSLTDESFSFDGGLSIPSIQSDSATLILPNRYY